MSDQDGLYDESTISVALTNVNEAPVVPNQKRSTYETAFEDGDTTVSLYAVCVRSAAT